MRCIIVLISILYLTGCGKKIQDTKVDYNFIPFYFGKIYLEKMPVNDEEYKVLDSAEITYQTEHLAFNIPHQEQAVFLLRMNGKPLRIYFINDAEHIIINGSSTDQKDYSFGSEGYNQHLKTYMDGQKKLIDILMPITERLRNNPAGPEQKKLEQQADSVKTIFAKNARMFADTTSSAGAFLFAYNSIDFENNRPGLKQFVLNAGKRFPDHQNIQLLKQATLDYISIYEEELNVGDAMPQLTLPDVNGTPLQVVAPNGKFQFIDLWATWCGSCVDFIPVKKESSEKFKNKLSWVSVAIDAEKDAWRSVINQQQLPGMNFIDERMWRGKAARAWKFDSIPFNYLVSPQGKIVAKAIKPDSLMYVLNKFVK